MLKLPLKKERLTANYRPLPWSSCAPFVDNSRGLLIHRPKTVSTHNSVRGDTHIGISYLCGNGTYGDGNLTFLDNLTGSTKLLCARCEAVAIAKGLPSSDELNGFHVHKGGLVAIKTCCDSADKEKEE